MFFIPGVTEVIQPTFRKKIVRATLKRLVEHIARGLTPLGSLILPTGSIYDNLSTIS